jgi:hypothetical protein
MCIKHASTFGAFSACVSVYIFAFMLSFDKLNSTILIYQEHHSAE